MCPIASQFCNEKTRDMDNLPHDFTKIVLEKCCGRCTRDISVVVVDDSHFWAPVLFCFNWHTFRPQCGAWSLPMLINKGVCHYAECQWHLCFISLFGIGGISILFHGWLLVCPCNLAMSGAQHELRSRPSFEFSATLKFAFGIMSAPALIYLFFHSLFAYFHFGIMWRVIYCVAVWQEIYWAAKRPNREKPFQFAIELDLL